MKKKENHSYYTLSKPVFVKPETGGVLDFEPMLEYLADDKKALIQSNVSAECEMSSVQRDIMFGGYNNRDKNAVDVLNNQPYKIVITMEDKEEANRLMNCLIHRLLNLSMTIGLESQAIAVILAIDDDEKYKIFVGLDSRDEAEDIHFAIERTMLKQTEEEKENVNVFNNKCGIKGKIDTDNSKDRRYSDHSQNRHKRIRCK